jgi:hypothetical protein
LKSTSATVATSAAISPEALGSADQTKICAGVAIAVTAEEDDEHHRFVLIAVETDDLADASVRDADVVQASKGSYVLGGCFESPHDGATAGAPEKVLLRLKFTRLSQDPLT